MEEYGKVNLLTKHVIFILSKSYVQKSHVNIFYE